MPLTTRELGKLRTQCNKLDDGPDYRIDDYVTNLLNTVLDFQMNVVTVSSSMDYYEHNHGYRTHKKLKEFVQEFPNTKSGNLKLANSLWGNNHWSRAKFLRKLLEELENRGIKGQKSLQNWIARPEITKNRSKSWHMKSR